MNKFIAIGRITRDLEIKYLSVSEPMAILKFSIAVNRKKKGEADFINCVAFKEKAEFIEKYFCKGSPIAISGRLQTGSYENKDKVKVYTTDIMIEEVDFAGDTKKGEVSSSQESYPVCNADDDIPF